jgi:hypothetical protein
MAATTGISLLSISTGLRSRIDSLDQHPTATPTSRHHRAGAGAEIRRSSAILTRSSVATAPSTSQASSCTGRASSLFNEPISSSTPVSPTGRAYSSTVANWFVAL